MMAVVWRNRIPALLTQKGMSISDLQKEVRMSWPATHRIATATTITDDTKVSTLRRIAAVLGVSVADLYEEVDE